MKFPATNFGKGLHKSFEGNVTVAGPRRTSFFLLIVHEIDTQTVGITFRRWRQHWSQSTLWINFKRSSAEKSKKSAQKVSIFWETDILAQLFVFCLRSNAKTSSTKVQILAHINSYSFFSLFAFRGQPGCPRERKNEKHIQKSFIIFFMKRTRAPPPYLPTQKMKSWLT